MEVRTRTTSSLLWRVEANIVLVLACPAIASSDGGSLLLVLEKQIEDENEFDGRGRCLANDVEREDADGVEGGVHADADPERAGAPVGEAEHGGEQ